MFNPAHQVIYCYCLAWSLGFAVIAKQVCCHLAIAWLISAQETFYFCTLLKSCLYWSDFAAMQKFLLVSLIE